MTHRRSTGLGTAALALALGSSACGFGDERERDAGSGSGVASLGDGAAAGTDAGDDGSGADDGPDSGADGTYFDLGSAGDPLPPGDEGCQRVDFLFVIDNSVSMEDNQTSLVGAFPGFMETIQNTLAADSDYHILVADTDEWGRCNTINGFSGKDPTSDTCNNYIKNTPFIACDAVLGAGVVHPAGQFASNQPCTPAGGNRYIAPGEADLPGTFACMATVGVAGHPAERPMDAMIAALQPAINMPGGCNDGFLRDDALLVVAFMSDDPNYEDAMGPDQWYDAVLAAKGGDPASVVVLGLTPDWDGCQDGKGPPKGAHWSEFVAKFGEHGLHGNVCGTAEEYNAFFEAAVATIDTACDEFEPPG